MKRLIQVFFAATVVFFLAVSCSKRPTYPVIDGIGACGNGIHDRGELGVDCGGSCPNQCTNVKFLEGEIYTRVPLNPNFQYIVTGPFIIRDKAALNIPAGTKIKVQPDVGAYIAVMQGEEFSHGVQQIIPSPLPPTLPNHAQEIGAGSLFVEKLL